jgi:hypothetical protein
MSPNPLTVPLLPDYPITESIPRNSLNMLCGASFSGKTMLLRSELAAYLRTGVLFGSPAPMFPMDDPEPAPIPLPMVARVGYLACTDSSTKVPIMPAGVAVLSWRKHLRRDDERPVTVDYLWHKFPEPRPQFLVVDGLQLLMPGGKVNDMCEVARWCAELTNWCEAMDVTILGTANTPKTKPGDPSYANQDRIAGSMQWAASVHNLLVLDLADQREETELRKKSIERETTRVLTTMTHGRRSVAPVYYDFDSEYRLVPTLTPSAQMSELEWHVALASTVAAHAAEEIRTAQMHEWGEALGLSIPTINRWIAEVRVEGKLDQIRKGLYKWVDKPAEKC